MYTSVFFLQLQQTGSQGKPFDITGLSYTKTITYAKTQMVKLIALLCGEFVVQEFAVREFNFM